MEVGVPDGAAGLVMRRFRPRSRGQRMRVLAEVGGFWDVLQLEGGGVCLVDGCWPDEDEIRWAEDCWQKEGDACWEEDCWPGSGDVFLVEDC